MTYLPDQRSTSVMGYPSPNGYSQPQGNAPPPLYPGPYQGGGPGYASQYQSYPSPTPATANTKGYSSQSFNMWYNSDKYGQLAPEPTNSQKFARLMFATMVTLLISMCMMSLVIWLVFGADVPEFAVESLSVSNLTISGGIVEATWDVNLTLTKPNTELKVNSAAMKASVSYKDYPLAVSSLQPLYLYSQRKKKFNIYFKMEHEKSICKDALAEEITKRQKAGTLPVSLRLGVASKFTTDSGGKQISLRIFCEDLRVTITPKGDGTLAEDSPKQCLIFA